MRGASWTDEHIAALRSFHAEGLSSREVMEALNKQFRSGYTRNSVIGKKSRMGLFDTDARKKSASARASQRSIQRIAKPKAPTRVNPRPQQFACEPSTGLRVADVIPRNITIYEPTEATCKWPFGENPPYNYCGCETFGDGPYCEPHTALGTSAGTRGEQAATRVSKQQAA